MGILDSASNAIKGAAAGTGRATKSFQLNGQLNDVAKQRAAFAAQLGASLFDETRNDPRFRASREDIYSAIEALDIQRDALQAELTQIEMEGQAAQQAAMTYVCPKCGGRVSATDSFCVGCGTPIAEIKKDLNLCPQCGTPLEDDAVFCVGCGSPIGNAGAASSVAAPNVAAQVPSSSGANVCSKCGAPLEDDAVFCVGCGSPVGDAAAAPSVAAQVPVSSGASLCPNCGAPLEDDAVFCAECGCPVGAGNAPAATEAPANDDMLDGKADGGMVSAEAVVVDGGAQEKPPLPSENDIPGLCPKCGYENIDTAKFCFNCGNVLK